MKTAPRNTLLTVVAFALALVLHAQAPKAQDQSQAQRDSAPSMQGMMEQCEKQCNGTMQQCDAVMSRLREARDSNDAAKMRSAIDETLKMCEEMKGMMSQCTEENRKACMAMMDMMGQMHGGMMSPTGRSSENQKKQTPSPER